MTNFAIHRALAQGNVNDGADADADDADFQLQIAIEFGVVSVGIGVVVDICNSPIFLTLVAR